MHWILGFESAVGIRLAHAAGCERGDETARGLDGSLAGVQRLGLHMTLQHVHDAAHGGASRRVVLDAEERDVDGAHGVLFVEVLHLLDVQTLVEQLHGAPLAHELKSPRREVPLLFA